MRNWNLTLPASFCLPLAADARCAPTDYGDDQIWELSLGAGEPPAIALHTTFGLRARALRLFPRFFLDEGEASDPAEFARPPVLRSFYPNYARLEFSPFVGIDVVAEVWVPESHAILGRFCFINPTEPVRSVHLEWAALLSPAEGQRMAADEIQSTPVLCGQTGELYPLVFLTGGARPGKSPYPSLVLDLDLPPGERACAAWSLTAGSSIEESFESSRRLTALNWDAHIARLELLNAGQVEVHTGNPDWDLAFAFSQDICHSLFVGPTPLLPAASFVTTRQPDQGYSLRGDGSDYSHLWSGQTPLDAYFLSGLLLPGSAGLLRGVLDNFLASQTESGFIDLKPGLGGQRSRTLAAPVLASLAWRLHQSTQAAPSLPGELSSRDYLAQVFPGLLSFFQAWFSPDHDRDQDGMPEWDHPIQTGLEDHPAFSSWHPWSLGVDISSAESPALGALLYRECRALGQIAALLGESDLQASLDEQAERLLTKVETMWDEAAAGYLYRDRDSHLSQERDLLAQHTGPGDILLQRQFEQPVRLVFIIETRGETRPQPRIFIYGEGITGQPRIERIEADQVRWSMERGVLTGERVYTSIDRVELQGLLPEDVVSLSTAGYCYQDLTMLFPLWAGIPPAERAAGLVERYLLNPDFYWRPFGLPACPQTSDEMRAVCGLVHLPLNCLVGEGLLAYGFHAEAAELVSRLMAGILENLKREGVLRRSFQADSAQGSGERNALGGLAPLGLFLDVLGVRLVSPFCAHLQGFNPFPWPVTVKYRGLTIMRQKEKSVVIFPDGQTIEVTDPAPQRICLQE